MFKNINANVINENNEVVKANINIMYAINSAYKHGNLVQYMSPVGNNRIFAPYAYKDKACMIKAIIEHMDTE